MSVFLLGDDQWLTDTRLDFSIEKGFYREIHTALHVGENELRERIDALDDGDQRDSLVDQFNERYCFHSEKLSRCFVLSFMCGVEYRLRVLGKSCAKLKNKEYEKQGYTTKGWPKEFARIHDYLLFDFGFQVPVGEEWEFLINSFICRNAIAHFDGRVQELSSENQANRALNFANQPGVKIVQIFRATEEGDKDCYGSVEFDSKFIPKLFSMWERWLDNVEKELLKHRGLASLVSVSLNSSIDGQVKTEKDELMID